MNYRRRTALPASLNFADVAGARSTASCRTLRPTGTCTHRRAGKAHRRKVTQIGDLGPAARRRGFEGGHVDRVAVLPSADQPPMSWVNLPVRDFRRHRIFSPGSSSRQSAMPTWPSHRTRCVASPHVTLIHLSRTTTSRSRTPPRRRPSPRSSTAPGHAMPLMVYSPPWAAERLRAGDSSCPSCGAVAREVLASH